MSELLAATSGFIQQAGTAWSWPLLTLHVISDALIGLSFIVISVALTYLGVKARREIPFSAMFIAFGVFLVACAFTHFIQIVTLWQPAFWFSGVAKAATAIASVITAALMPRIVPVAVKTVREIGAVEDQRVRLETAIQANEAKSQFMATMSHELRTPLNAIVGYTDLLENEIAGPINEQQGKFLARLRLSAAHLLALITQVLDFERIEAGRDTVVMERADIGQLLHEAVALVSPAADQKHIRLSTDIPNGLFFVTDVGKVRQIVLNLLSNALKYTDKGEVTLRATIAMSGLRIEVVDTGIGIVAEDQPRIFDPFWQADRRLTRKAGGAGLGLAIVDRFTHSLDGSLRVESEPGHGTTFAVLIPPGALPGTSTSSAALRTASGAGFGAAWTR
jgi:signal transduction histidine kinase